MRNAKQCGCSFSQTDSAFAGERIRVNGANSCGCGNHHCHCQDSCRPKPCPPKPCPPKPCPPRPCPPRPRPPKPCPSCEDRCASQYRNCMRNCRWERDNNCGCRNDFNPYDHMNDFDSYGSNCGCGHQRNANSYGMHDQWNDSYDDGVVYQDLNKSYDENEEGEY